MDRWPCCGRQNKLRENMNKLEQAEKEKET